VSLLELYNEGIYDEGTYLLYEAVLEDTVYGCIVEHFGDQGGNFAATRINIGEPTHPINGSTVIEDDSARALHLTDKLTSPIFKKE
jgi:hypothetical protein